MKIIDYKTNLNISDKNYKLNKVRAKINKISSINKILTAFIIMKINNKTTRANLEMMISYKFRKFLPKIYLKIPGISKNSRKFNIF